MKWKGKKKKGRPMGSLLKKPEQKATIPMRVSPELYNLIEPELKKNETYSDTILRLLKESRWAHINEGKKVRALLETLSSVPDAEKYISIANERALSYDIDSRYRI